MREEIVKLLERENKLSDDALSEIKNIEIDDFSNIVKEVGNEETVHQAVNGDKQHHDGAGKCKTQKFAVVKMIGKLNVHTWISPRCFTFSSARSKAWIQSAFQ